MPSASPIAVIMLTMKNDSEVNWPRTDDRATVTTMDTMAMLIGMNAATSAPKTRTSTIMRRRQPELQLPVGEVGLRELVEVVVEGVVPGDVDVEVGVGVRGDHLVQHVRRSRPPRRAPSTSVTTAA